MALGEGGDVAGPGVELEPSAITTCSTPCTWYWKCGASHSVGAGERLDVLGPAPAGLQGQPADLGAADPQQVQRAALEPAGLVGRRRSSSALPWRSWDSPSPGAALTGQRSAALTVRPGCSFLAAALQPLSWRCGGRVRSLIPP